jgi:hypothetical protein
MQNCHIGRRRAQKVRPMCLFGTLPRQLLLASIEGHTLFMQAADAAEKRHLDPQPFDPDRSLTLAYSFFFLLAPKGNERIGKCYFIKLLCISGIETFFYVIVPQLWLAYSTIPLRYLTLLAFELSTSWRYLIYLLSIKLLHSVTFYNLISLIDNKYPIDNKIILLLQLKLSKFNY